MTNDELIANLSEQQVVALTLFGEARAEAIEGRIAVANIIRNRVKAQNPRMGLTPKQVCLKRWQFSCWIPEGGRANHETVLDAARSVFAGERPGPILRECLWIADGLLREQFRDTVSGATHYYAPAAMRPAGSRPPWVEEKQPVAVIGGHLFYAGVRA